MALSWRGRRWVPRFILFHFCVCVMNLGTLGSVTGLGWDFEGSEKLLQSDVSLRRNSAQGGAGPPRARFPFALPLPGMHPASFHGQ